jgi:hypothetical protein
MSCSICQVLLAQHLISFFGYLPFLLPVNGLFPIGGGAFSLDVSSFAPLPITRSIIFSFVLYIQRRYWEDEGDSWDNEENLGGKMEGLA